MRACMLRSDAAAMSQSRPAHPYAPTEFVVRSLFPLVALALLGSVLLCGPWPFLAATYLWWRLVTLVG